MREEPVSNCEKQFIQLGLLDNVRIDDRSRDEFRPVKLVVGSEVGTALCTLGNTKVFCSVVGQLTEPTRSRPAKGLIYIEVDMSPMANPNHQHNRLGAKGLELRRMLGIVLRDSRCIDVESLCVRTGKQVWKLVINVKVLDDDGSLLDCASIAAVTALHHFRRPNITVEPSKTIVHSEWEQALIPLNIYHMPICVMYGFTNDGEVALVDPTAREEKYLDGCLWIACNKRKEICALHQTSKLILSTGMIEACVRKAFERAMNITELIHAVCVDDAAKRAKYVKPAGFDVTVNEEFLNTHESHPNELIAPATSGAATVCETANQPSVILNENPLVSDAVSMDETEEDRKIAGQVENIVSSVGVCNISPQASTEKTPKEEMVDKEEGRKRATLKERKERNKKKELNEIADLLDDLEGETVQLEPSALIGGDVEMADGSASTNTPDASGGFDLASAKKKKRT